MSLHANQNNSEAGYLNIAFIAAVKNALLSVACCECAYIVELIYSPLYQETWIMTVGP